MFKVPPNSQNSKLWKGGMNVSPFYFYEGGYMDRNFSFKDWVIWFVGIVIICAFALFLRASIVIEWIRGKVGRKNET